MAGVPNGGVCVVVGATGAVGSEVVRRLTAGGWPVLPVARNASSESEVCTADLAEDACVPVLREALAGRPVALALFAAGLAVTGSADEIEPGALTRAFDLKVGGMLRLVRGLAEGLVPGSRLVAVAGSLGLEPGPLDAAPGTVNAALLNLMRQLSLLYGPRGVMTATLMLGPLDSPRLRSLAAQRARESGVSPGDVMVGYEARVSSGRLPTPGQAAWLVETLLAPEASILHGAAIQADAGARHVII